MENAQDDAAVEPPHEHGEILPAALNPTAQGTGFATWTRQDMRAGLTLCGRRPLSPAEGSAEALAMEGILALDNPVAFFAPAVAEAPVASATRFAPNAPFDSVPLNALGDAIAPVAPATFVAPVAAINPVPLAAPAPTGAPAGAAGPSGPQPPFPKKKYDCGLCPWSFSEKNGLDRHDRAVHRREKPHVCKDCGKALGRKGTQNRHTADACNGRKRYWCPMDGCDEKFSERGGLTKHLTTRRQKLNKEEAAPKSNSVDPICTE